MDDGHTNSIDGPSAYKESVWPHQWIGTCARCKGGIRCNDQAEVKRFINRHKACWQASLHQGEDT